MMSAPIPSAESQDLLFDDPAVELSSNRTSLSLERTRMSADRTLMSIVRTAVSLITFGFTISQAFHELRLTNVAVISEAAPRNFGLALILLGVLLLIMGIASHALFGSRLNDRRGRLFACGLLRHDLRYRATPTMVTAVLLLVIGLAAAAGILLRLELAL